MNATIFSVTNQQLLHLVAKDCVQMRKILVDAFPAPEMFSDKKALLHALSDKSQADKLGRQVRQLAGADSTKELDWTTIAAPHILCVDDYDIFADFEEAYTDGWFAQHREEMRLEHMRLVEDFVGHHKALNIKAGETLWFQDKQSSSQWAHGIILFVHPSFSSILLELPKTEERTRNRLLILGEDGTLLMLYRQPKTEASTHDDAALSAPGNTENHTEENFQSDGEPSLEQLCAELKGKVAEPYVRDIAARILHAEDTVSSLRHGLTQVHQLALKETIFGPPREDVAARAAESLGSN